MTEARHVLVKGRVQGVGYRWSCTREAEALGVSGWVRNRHDGSVEAWAQGAPDAVGRLLDWMRRGPPGARVDRLDVQPVEPTAEHASGFAQRPTA